VAFKEGTCPSCTHPQHVGSYCSVEIGTEPDENDPSLTASVRCLCPPEKAIKADNGKASRWRLLAWDVIPEVLGVYNYGISKGYLAESWRNVEVGRYEDALMRHMTAHLRGEVRDPESGLRHIAHVAWNALAVMALHKEAA
jgi:hypothetical protein